MTDEFFEGEGEEEEEVVDFGEDAGEEVSSTGGAGLAQSQVRKEPGDAGHVLLVGGAIFPQQMRFLVPYDKGVDECTVQDEKGDKPE